MTKDQARVARTANAILWLWNEEIKKAGGDHWARLESRQAYRYTLRIMVDQGLIEDYDVTKQQVKIGGVWSAARTVLEVS